MDVAENLGELEKTLRRIADRLELWNRLLSPVSAVVLREPVLKTCQLHGLLFETLRVAVGLAQQV